MIKKAKISCENSEVVATEYFSQLEKSLNLPNDAVKYSEDYAYKLTCYACYLITQNGDEIRRVNTR